MAVQPPSGATRRDAFHRGAFYLIQPTREGHRAGLDAMVLAASVPNGFSGHLADLGAGAGAAGFAVAARCVQAQVTLVENAPEMVTCARESVALDENSKLSDRIIVLQSDVTLAGRARAESGLGDRQFDFVIMNPPFNSHAHRGTADALRKAAHVMHEGLLDAWLKTASAILRPGGTMALIARPESLLEILSAMSGRFGAAEIVALHPRANAAAIRLVIRARKGARGSPALLPPLILHDGDNSYTSRTAALCNGRATLFES